MNWGKKHTHTFWLWEWGLILAPNFGDGEPCKFGHVEQCESRSRSANDTGAEKVSLCKVVKCLDKRSLNLGETELNAVGKHKSGYVQQSVKIKSRSENNTDIVEMMLCYKFGIKFLYKS